MKRSARPKRIQLGKPITITRCKNRGADVFVVSWYDEHGRRQRLSRATEVAAQEEAAAIAETLKRGQPIETRVTEADRAILERSKELLRPHGLDMDHAFAVMTHALKHVDIHTMVEAVRWYEMNRPGSVTPKTAKEVLAEMLKAKADRSHYTVSDLRRKLKKFVDDFNCPLLAVGTSQIESFIHGLNVGARTKANVLRAIGTLMGFAKRKRYLPQSHPGITEVERVMVPTGEIKVFTPEEMEILLKNAPRELLPPLLFGGFCGLRTEEIKRLDWRDVKVDRGFVEIRAANAKTRVRRLAKIPENIRGCLKQLQEPEGPVSVYKNPVNELLDLAKRCDVTWKRNGLRHSMITYRVAQTEDVPAVALEAGTSPKMVHTNYLRFVEPDVAEKWFAIVPPVLKGGKEELPVQEQKQLTTVNADGSSESSGNGKEILVQP